MKQDYTHISIILDRTGSMESIRDDTIGGFNAFLQEQKRQPGTATLTLVQFDTQDPYEVVHDFKLVGAVPELTRETYVPRAATPLLDAIGRGINDLEQRIGAMEEESRPASVVMVVITDGQENSSQEFRKDQVEKMIADKQEAGWQLVFLSADLDAIRDALDTGFAPRATMAFEKTADSVNRSWHMLSRSVSAYRKGWEKQVGFDREELKHRKEELRRRHERMKDRHKGRKHHVKS